MYAICRPFSVHMSGNAADAMPSPTNASAPTPSSTTAESAFACERSTGTKSATHARIPTLKASARTSVAAHIPRRCVSRGTGDMNVYSIVPSQRSHAITSPMFSKMIPRNRQAIVPMSR